MTLRTWIAAGAAIIPLALACGCDVSGRVEQGRVVAYDRKTELVTLIPESAPGDAAPGVLPPVTVKTPADPDEMGPAPVPGNLMRVDTARHLLTVFDPAAQAFRTIPYTPLAERRDVAKAPSAPPVDRARKTITVYSPEQHLLVTFPASDDLLALPDDTWQPGDLVRYYYRQPRQALRFMNVTRTDLSKPGE
jgi:hypothetical protein